ncbi:DUF3192 domain-containing protein [Arsukibacterium sp.]|uniref:DUF3192 domain-containing protein n=1 Tax=Arsukibacterium sp. TaxID=1977258 RepID=UPI002FD98D48
MIKLKPFVYFGIGIISYAFITLAVLLFYKDDPAQMSWQDREAFNHKFISRLDIKANLTQDDIMQRLGGPDITEAVRYQQQVHQLLYYRTHRKLADGITTADECTALLFIDRQLVAVADDALSQYKELPVHDSR